MTLIEHPAARTTNPNGTLKLGVGNPAFLLERLAADCGPLQQYRELTVNGIQAVQATGQQGIVEWDVFWPLLETEGVYKLSCVDTGVGMTGPEMLHYINKLSSSVHEQGLTQNFGVGAKIASMTRNREGLTYLSWKDGVGSMVRLWLDPNTDEYGAYQFELADGTFSHWAPVPDHLKPKQIGDHGTCVVLMGNSADEDTTVCPLPELDGTRWLTKYLNTRFYQVPDGVTIRARESMHSNNDNNVVFSTIVGQAAYLDGADRKGNPVCDTSGVVDLAEARVHWHILAEGDNAKKNGSRVQASKHTAVLYQDELYELVTGRSANGRIQQFGVIFGVDRVVLYVEPTGDVTSNTARTQITTADGAPLPFSEWGVQFAANLPAELIELQEQSTTNNRDKDRQKELAKRLESIKQLFQVSRYRQARQGNHGMGGTEPSMPSRRERQRTEKVDKTADTKTERTKRKPNLFDQAAKEGSNAHSDDMDAQIPTVTWQSLILDGYEQRAEGDLEDRAAKYVPEHNTIIANADFRVFDDMVTVFAGEYGSLPGFEKAVRDAVEIWVEQALCETVMGMKSLDGGKLWNDEQMAAALSEEALTAAVMQRYHVHNCVKRHLGTATGSLRMHQQREAAIAA